MGKRTTIYLTDADLAAAAELGRTPVQLLRDGIASHREGGRTMPQGLAEARNVSLTVEAAAGLIGHLAAAVERSLAVVDTEAQLRHEPEPADLSGRRFCSRCGLRIYQNVAGLDPGHDPDEWAHEEMPPVAGSYRRWVYACPGRAQQPQEAR